MQADDLLKGVQEPERSLDSLTICGIAAQSVYGGAPTKALCLSVMDAVKQESRSLV